MELLLRNLTKVFPDRRDAEDIVAIEDVSLRVAEGEFLCVVGPSGCGKSTLLKLLAGLTLADRGEVWAGGEPVKGPHASRGMIFQEYALFPWRTVEENIAFGLEIKGIPREERRRRARAYLETVHLHGFGQRYPHELSGGMKQRVALARAFINEPRVLLMDEPFGSLDAQTRKVMQQELLRIWEGSRTTVVFVTHSVLEAVFLADRIIALTARPGKVKGEIEVSLPRPRSYTDEAFLAVRKRVLDLIEEEVMKALHLEMGEKADRRL